MDLKKQRTLVVHQVLLLPALHTLLLVASEAGHLPQWPPGKVVMVDQVVGQLVKRVGQMDQTAVVVMQHLMVLDKE